MIKNIKDESPNEDLVKQLEDLLEDAKAGRIRSVFSICSWSDDQVTHSWAYDRRSSRRRILAEMVLLQHNYVVDTEFAEADGVLHARFEEWE